MGLDSLNKDTSGASLIKSFKDIFPGKLESLYIYRGTNLVSKGNEVFSREDTKTFIALELLGKADAIFGGEALASTLRTITESKNVKETARQKVSTNSITAFLKDLSNIDLTQHNLYYTIGKPFVQGDLKQDQLNVLSDANIVPNLLEKLISGTTPISQTQANIITNNKSVSFTLSPAVIDNNLPASVIRFVDSTIYKVLPIDEQDFEIVSIDIESDQTLALEWRNGIKARGLIDNGTGNLIEEDLDFKMDKPLLPLKINPYAKFSNIQFVIENFNYYQRLPFLSARHFLGADRSITSFIKGTSNDSWASDLATAIVDMFKMSWAISTGFQAYRTGTDNGIDNTVIGGVSLKTMEGKDPDKLFSYVDQILRNWEYKDNVKNQNTPEYKRALQVLAASSQVIQSSYCVGKGLTEFHKTIFDFWLNLDTLISKETTDIEMTLVSNIYVFTYEETQPGVPDLTKPIINLSPIYNISKTYVTNFGRLTSLSELDDPININGFSSFAGDIDPTKADSVKYFVGVDITDPAKIAQFLGDAAADTTDTHQVNEEIDSPWYVSDIYSVDYGSFGDTGKLIEGQTYHSQKIESSGKTNRYDKVPTLNTKPILSETERNAFIMKAIDIPSNAHKVVVNLDNVKEEILKTSVKYHRVVDKSNYNLETEMIRYTGAIVTYEVVTTTHGVSDKKQTYDKGEFLNMILKYSGTSKWKRNLTLDDNWRDATGALNAKIKTINHIFISSFLGNYIDIKLNYKYKDDQGTEVTGTTLLPRIDLPAKDDERRTKLGIRL